MRLARGRMRAAEAREQAALSLAKSTIDQIGRRPGLHGTRLAHHLDGIAAKAVRAAEALDGGSSPDELRATLLRLSAHARGLAQEFNGGTR